MAYKDLSATQRLIAVHTDFMRHKNFAILGGVTQVGKVIISDEISTAGTDGADVYYSEAFIMPMTRKQLRYLVGHEQLHKALHHCTDYGHLKAKHPDEFAQAIDYVVNGTLESMDLDGDFLERPTSVPPLVDPAFNNKSLPEVMRELLKKGGGGGKPMDVHMDGGQAKPGDKEVEECKDIRTQIADAMAQGALVQEKLRGEGAGDAKLGGYVERPTDWRPPLRRFLTELCEGDEHSRFSPPNKRLLPLGIIMPSHFSEASGEIIIAADTSGSMHSILPQVFGEVAAICKSTQPSSVRVLWWDTRVAGDQAFAPKDYAAIAGLMAPRGGGGTTVSCVARYIAEKKYKPKAVVMLTDGYIESQYDVPPGNVLWGIFGNSRFVPIRGKVLHIQEL